MIYRVLISESVALNISSSKYLETMQKKIYEVTSVSHHILKTIPLTLVVDAIGNAATTGWENGELHPHVYVDPPEDGIYGFDFVADAPPNEEVEVISKIEAKSYSWKGFPLDLQGVRVIAVTNDIAELID